MSKVTPSALRGLSVAAGTVGLAAAGAALTAGQACAAESGPSLAGGGLPVSTNAVPAVAGAVAHNHGTIAGIPLSGLPFLGQLPGMVDNASPASDALPGLGYADLGEVPLTRSRAVPGTRPQGVRTTHVAQHAAPHAAAPHVAPAPAAPAYSPAKAAAPASQAPAPAAAPVPNAQTGPLDSVTNALHGLPVVGGLGGGLNGLGGLTGGLASIGG